MSKVSKLLVMTIVILAVVTLSATVNANTTALIDYVTTRHNINGVEFELTPAQKNDLADYITRVSDAQADTALARVKEVEAMVAATGARSLEDISSADMAKIKAKAESAASAIGLSLSVNTKAGTFSLTGSGLSISGSKAAVVNSAPVGGGNGGNGGNGSAVGAASGSPVAGTYLYTGASYVAFSAIVLAIVAVAVVVKKRA